MNKNKLLVNFLLKEKRIKAFLLAAIFWCILSILFITQVAKIILSYSESFLLEGISFFVGFLIAFTLIIKIY